jgi:hypothetical protein
LRSASPLFAGVSLLLDEPGDGDRQDCHRYPGSRLALTTTPTWSMPIV